MNNFAIQAAIEEERSLDATSFNGTLQDIGDPLSQVPVIIIFDNQSDVSVPIYVGSILFKTLLTQDVLTLDLRSNHGIASNFGFSKNTQFGTNASAGLSGSIKISVIYARKV